MATPGSLVEYYNSKRVMCALCLRTDNKDNIIVRNEENREDKIPRSKVLSQSAGGIAPTQDPSEITQWLRNVSQNRENLAQAINLEEIWELLVDDQATMELDDLAGLCFTKKADPDQRSALFRALDHDKIFFVRKLTNYLPRTRALVLETQQRQRNEEERAVEREVVGKWLRRLWDGTGSATAGKAESRYLTWIREVAASGSEASHFKEIQSLFKDLEIGGKDAAFRVLVKAGVWSEDEFITMHRLHPPDEFAEEIIAAAAAAFERGSRPGSDRLDLVHLDCITIDDADTTEIDDALSLELLEQGGYRIGVHIADVTAYVEIGSVLDKEARERGTCIYLPERKLRMLPEVLGDQGCSLVAGDPRLAFSFLVVVDAHANISSVQLKRSQIRVRERLTYEEADRQLKSDVLPQWAPLLDLCRLLRQKRSDAGAFTLPFGRVSLKVNDQVEPPDIRIFPEEANSASQLIVSELMIMANRIAAEYCVEHALPAIFRSQPTPEQALPKDNLTPEVVFKMRRFLRKGEVGLDPQRHSGLGLDAYLQATSPIRRYSDLLIQRQMSAHLAGEPAPYTRSDLEEMLIDVGRTASQAEQLERERKLYWTLRYLEMRRFQELDAIVLANFPDKHIIQLQPMLFETDCAHVAGRPLPPGSRIKVRIDVVWPRQESVRVSPVFDEDDE